MKGQLVFRQTCQKSKSDKDVYVVFGVVTLEGENIKGEYKYDLLDMAVNNGVKLGELDDLSPEDLLSERIWKVE